LAGLRSQYLSRPLRPTQPGHPSVGRRNEYRRWLRPSLGGNGASEVTTLWHFINQLTNKNIKNKLAYHERQPHGLVMLTSSVLNRPKPVCSCNGAYCYAELAVSSPAVAEIVASTHCTYMERDGKQTDLLQLNRQLLNLVASRLHSFFGESQRCFQAVDLRLQQTLFRLQPQARVFQLRHVRLQFLNTC